MILLSSLLKRLPIILAVSSIFLVSTSRSRAQLSQAELTKKITPLEQLTTRDADQQKALDLYQKAALLAETRAANQATIQQYQTAIETAPQTLDQLQNTPPSFQLPTASDTTTLKSLNRQLGSISAELSAQKAQLSKLEAEIQQRNARLKSIPVDISTIRTSLSELSQTAAANDPLAGAANELNLQQRENYNTSIKLLETELELYSAEAELYTARRQSTLNLINKLSKAELSWQKLIQSRLSIDAQRAVKVADKLVTKFSAIPELQSIAQSNAQLAQKLSGENGLTQRVSTLEQYRTNLENTLLRTTEQRNDAVRRISLLEEAQLDIDTDTGALLRRNRANIPDTESLTADLKYHLKESANAQMEIINLSTLADQEPSDINAHVEKLSAIYQEQGITSDDLKELFSQRRKLITTFNRELAQYDLSLRNVNDTTRKAITTYTEYAHFLDSRLLWIASAPPLSLGDFSSEVKSILHVFSADVFGKWLSDILQDALHNWWLWLPVIAIFTSLITTKKRWRAKLISAGEAAERRNCSSFMPTLGALLYTIILSAPLSILTAFLASRTAATSPVLPALIHVAIFNGLIGFLRRLARPHGLLESHFKIEEQRTQLLYRHLSWYFPLILPFIFLIPTLTGIDESRATGRLTYIAALTISGALLYLLCKPTNKLFCQADQASRFAKTIYALSIIIPLGLIIGSMLGYFASVRIIHNQIFASLTLILTALFLVALLLRWGLVSRRRIAIQQALRRREAALAERKRQDDEGEPHGDNSDIPTLEEVNAEAIRVAQVQGKTTQLIRVSAICAIAFGLWGIWSTSLPALSVLDGIALWGGEATPTDNSSTTTKASAAPLTPLTAATDSATTSAPDTKKEVTLQDLLMLCVILFLTYTAARNIPSLLELAILSRVKMKPGGAFAITTTLTYAIVVIGIVIAFGKIGITWQKVQWIAAAVTLGIGFGLQEVFANFVAGLILLFERPIRLGDFITIGDVSGRVTEISIRATTIQQANNRELLVPNKQFITGQLVNWTLKDSVLRVDILVGIAYNSDTQLARKELLQVAHENKRVISTPAPDVSFEAFGDSTLNLALRCYINGIDNFSPVQTELRFEIDRAFRAANIEIAYPQRDINIRSLPPISICQKSDS